MVLLRSDLQKRFFVLQRLCLSLAERANSKRRTSVTFHSIFFRPISFFTKKIILSDGIKSQVAQIIPKQLILSKTSFFFQNSTGHKEWILLYWRTSFYLQVFFKLFWAI